MDKYELGVSMSLLHLLYLLKLGSRFKQTMKNGQRASTQFHTSRVNYWH